MATTENKATQEKPFENLKNETPAGVTPNTTAPVVETQKARISEKTATGLNYRVTAIDLQGNKVSYIKPVAYDVEAKYKSWVGKGYTEVKTWSLSGDFWKVDTSFLKSEKKASTPTRAIDETLVLLLNNLATSFFTASGMANKGNFSDELAKELHEDAQKLFKHIGVGHNANAAK